MIKQYGAKPVLFSFVSVNGPGRYLEFSVEW